MSEQNLGLCSHTARVFTHDGESIVEIEGGRIYVKSQFIYKKARAAAVCYVLLQEIEPQLLHEGPMCVELNTLKEVRDAIASIAEASLMASSRDHDEPTEPI